MANHTANHTAPDLLAPDAAERERGELPPERARSRRLRTVLVGTITLLLAGVALKATSAVTLPLVFGMFLAALAWPLHHRLRRVVPRGVSVAVSVIAVAAVVAGFGWAVAESVDEIGERADRYREQVDRSITELRTAAEQVGVALPEDGGEAFISRAIEPATRLSLDIIGGGFLALAFLGLGLVEVPAAKRKLRELRWREDRVRELAGSVATEMQRYFLVRTAIGLVTGGLCALGAWMIGLEMWWLWGVLNFLLNYIPTIGSVVGVVPPVAFAFIQPGGGWQLALLALATVGGVQLVMGNWIDPLVQGKALSLSPLVVLLSVVLWGWVWGIAGALIGVPITLLTVLVCREKDSTRWVATLLVEDPEQARPRLAI